MITLYQTKDFEVRRAPRKGFEVYRNTLTHAIRCAVIGYEGDYGLQRAKLEADRRQNELSKESL